MMIDDFITRHAKPMQRIWAGVANQYGVTEREFAERLAAIALRGAGKAAASPSKEEVQELLSSIKGDELCLAIACEKGDVAAWRDFETLYRHSMLAAARGMSRDEAEAEDLIQYVFGELYGIRLDGDRRLSKLAHYSGRGSLGGWLRAVVYQCFIDRKRLTSRFEQVEEVEEFDRLANASSAYINGGLSMPPSRPDEIEDTRLRRATEDALSQAVAAIEPRDRLLLNYYYFDDLTLKEIGLLMGVHEATISRWLARAQREVRKKTEEILHHRYGMRRAEVAECLQLAARTEIDIRDLLRDVKGPPVERAP